MQQCGHEHRIGHGAIQFVLLEGKGDDSDAPAHHSEAAINQLLKTNAENFGMQLCTVPQIPHNTMRRSATIGVGRTKNSAKVEQHGADKSKRSQEGEQRTKMVVQRAVTDPAAIRCKGEHEVGDEEAGYAIEGICGAIAHRGRDSNKRGTGNEDEEQQLGGEEREGKDDGMEMRGREMGPEGGRRIC